MYQKNRFKTNGQLKQLKFYWAEQSLHTLLKQHVPANVYFRAEENYPVLAFYLNKDCMANQNFNVTASEALHKMKTQLFRGSKAKLLLKKSIFEMGKTKVLDSNIVEIGYTFKNQLSGFSLNVLSEDYTSDTDSISVYVEIKPLKKTELEHFINDISRFYEVN